MCRQTEGGREKQDPEEGGGNGAISKLADEHPRIEYAPFRKGGGKPLPWRAFIVETAQG